MTALVSSVARGDSAARPRPVEPLPFRRSARPTRWRSGSSHVGAAHRWGGRFAFESLRSSIAAVDGVLPVSGVDFGAVGDGPFCSQGGVRAGGGPGEGDRHQLTAMPLVLASSVRVVGEPTGRSGPLRASSGPSAESDRSIRTRHPPSGVNQCRMSSSLGNGSMPLRFTTAEEVSP